MKFDETKLKKYLLDELSSEETEEIELQILDDSDFQTSIALAEHDLIEDFIDERLSASERENFQKNFLVSTRRTEELEFTRSLRKQAAEFDVYKKNSEEKVSLGETLRTFFSLKTFQIAAVSLIVLVVIFGIWRFSENSQNELTKETIALNQTNLNDLSAYKTSPQLSLISGTFRGNDAAQSLSKDNLTQPILLRLALQGNFSKKPSAKLFRDENLLFALDEANIYQNSAGSEVRLLLPSTKLEKGNYRLELQAGNEKAVYNFSLK